MRRQSVTGPDLTPQKTVARFHVTWKSHEHFLNAEAFRDCPIHINYSYAFICKMFPFLQWRKDWKTILCTVGMSCVVIKSCVYSLLQIELLLLQTIRNGPPNAREIIFKTCALHVKIHPAHRTGQEVELSENKRIWLDGLGKILFNSQVLFDSLQSCSSRLKLTGNVMMLMVKSPRVHTV